MTLPTRGILFILCGLLACVPAAAQGSGWVRIVVPAPTGGNLDAVARKLAQRLTALTGEPHVVENRPGGSSQIAMEAVVRAAPDGRTLLYAGTGIVFQDQLQKLPFSPLEELSPVIQVTRESYVFATSAASGLSLDNLSLSAQSKPGGLDCVTPPGLTALACEQLKARLGGRLTVVAYNGVAPSLNALLSGVGDIMFVNASAAIPLIEAGRLRALAVSQRKGMPPAAAGAPVLADVWPGFVLTGLSGLFVPARTPQARIEQINRDMRRVLGELEVDSMVRESAQEPVGGSAAQFAEVLAREQRRFTRIIRSLGLAPG